MRRELESERLRRLVSQRVEEENRQAQRMKNMSDKERYREIRHYNGWDFTMDNVEVPAHG